MRFLLILAYVCLDTEEDQTYAIKFDFICLSKVNKMHGLETERRHNIQLVICVEVGLCKNMYPMSSRLLYSISTDRNI